MDSRLEKLLNRWIEDGKVGEPIMTICEIIALVICTVYSIRTNIGKVFFLYISFDFLISIFDYYLMYFSDIPKYQTFAFIYISNALISAVEICVYYYFFFHVLRSVSVKRAMKFLLIAYGFIFAGLMMLKDHKADSYRHISGIIGATEFLFVLFPCLIYYFELFSIKTSEDLLKRPAFWIVTGIFFYSVVSIPYYLIYNFLQTNKYHSVTQLSMYMFYIPFSINFLFLSKAFLCKKLLTI